MNATPSLRQYLIGILFLLASCHSKQARIPSDQFLDDDRINETSGIAASHLNPGFLYVHNDSGDSSRFFAITPDGHLQTILDFNGDPALPLGVTDCEDIAVGPGPDPNSSYVYIGDIGDNNGGRKHITIYRIKEPILERRPVDSARSSGSGIDSTAPFKHLSAEPLFLQYPDGPRDAETLMLDPIEKLIYIVSKREDSVHVYSTPLNFKAHDKVILTKHTNLYFPGTNNWITAGDISADGAQILVKSYTKVYFWPRPAQEPVWKTLQRPPTTLPYIIEPQGEAIGFDFAGAGYYTVGEGKRPELFYYKVPY
ncbi:MAG TPA: hypothetical protein VGM31_19375 [Puia sp.]